jgi:hypothetical protein
MEIAVMTSLFTKRDVKIDSGHEEAKILNMRSPEVMDDTV